MSPLWRQYQILNWHGSVEAPARHGRRDEASDRVEPVARTAGPEEPQNSMRNPAVKMCCE
jgi:hypothetical protein